MKMIDSREMYKSRKYDQLKVVMELNIIRETFPYITERSYVLFWFTYCRAGVYSCRIL